MLTRSIYITKAVTEVCIKTRSTSASLPSKGQVPEQTTVKWSIHNYGLASGLKWPKFRATSGKPKELFLQMRFCGVQNPPPLTPTLIFVQ